MSLIKNTKIKYKLLSYDELVINMDRLSRFKLPEDTFRRVFYSIILKYLIIPKYSKADLDNLDPKFIANTVKKIWNESVKNVCSKTSDKYIVNKALKIINENTFTSIDSRILTFINAKLSFSPILFNINNKDCPINIKFLQEINRKFETIDEVNFDEIKRIRLESKTQFPIEKLLIVEGITEEILLPVFAKKLNFDFNKNGIYVLGAGGKSKSPSLYLQVKDRLKIPIVLLFDADASEICANLSKSLCNKDKIILIEQGEFEDIISLNLLKRSLNNEYKPATPLIIDDLHQYSKMCNNIENFYRTRHLGEYKKSKVSKIIADNVKYSTDVTEEVKQLIENIVKK